MDLRKPLEALARSGISFEITPDVFVQLILCVKTEKLMYQRFLVNFGVGLRKTHMTNTRSLKKENKRLKEELDDLRRDYQQLKDEFSTLKKEFEKYKNSNTPPSAYPHLKPNTKSTGKSRKRGAPTIPARR